MNDTRKASTLPAGGSQSDRSTAQGMAADQARPSIDANQDPSLREWARKLDASPEQIREAIGAVGSRADDVELYLKGSRSTSNSERTTRTKER